MKFEIEYSELLICSNCSQTKYPIISPIDTDKDLCINCFKKIKDYNDEYLIGCDICSDKTDITFVKYNISIKNNGYNFGSLYVCSKHNKKNKIKKQVKLWH